ncbi:MAG: Eco57I restriction-modification methylase domain-containing protein, partial [Treponema sp.]|nr:Eco57I restriction-modification methylase domain-containing protein [Treponema sp.]
RVLFEDLCENNPDTDKLTLFKKTQKLLDRILFILFCEDKNLLPTNSTVGIINDWKALKKMGYPQPLYNLFKTFFERINTGFINDDDHSRDIFAYNGGLFKPDEILDRVKVGDDVLYIHSQRLANYDFESQISVDILGRIFENSLTEIEEVQNEIENEKNGIKTENTNIGKRKKDGVFYTPEYITHYIVENTIGTMCEKKRAELKINDDEYSVSGKKGKAEAARLTELEDRLEDYRKWLLSLKILDPACGSGAFLNAALKKLRQEHTLVDYYHGRIRQNEMNFSEIDNAILENNIYGVDINEESVEIAKLSLWLSTAKKNRKLSTLANNIKCGNSLIADPAIAGEKAFDWKKEFPEVFEKGGFDVVIGNPPYVRVQNLKNSDVDYYVSYYKTPCGKLDISILFFERGFDLLNKNGILSFISTSQWLQTEYGKNIRKFLLDGKICEIMDFGSLPVFKDADTYPAIFALKQELSKTFIYKKVPSASDLEIGQLKAIQGKTYEISDYNENAWEFSDFNLILHLQKKNISYKQLKIIAPSYIGCLTGKDEAFVIPSNKVEELNLEKELIFPYAYRGEEVYSYSQTVPASFVIYPYNQDGSLIDEDVLKKNYPNIYNYLFQFKSTLEKRLDSRKLYATGKNWFRLLRPGQFSYILPKKILLKGIGVKMSASILDIKTAFNGANVPAIVLPQESNIDKLLLCILNSKLISYYMTSICPKKLGGYYRFNSTNISSIPIPDITSPKFSTFNSQLSVLADKMLNLNADLQKKVSRFIGRIKETYSLEKTTQNIENFYTLSFADFVKELAKQKVKLSMKQKDELEDYFNEYVKGISVLNEEIEKTDKEINAIVYQMYGLTDEEIRIIEQNHGDKK